MIDLARLSTGAAAAAVIGVAAHRARTLSISGALGAALMGTVAVGAGWSWGVFLVAYFVSASALSRFRASDRARRVGGLIEKDGPRDIRQVAANGGAFALCAIGSILSQDPLWLALAAAALGASAADTWATEIGTLARATPRSILDWHPVPVGTSGGVTLQGTLAAIAGAAFTAAVAWLVRWPITAVAASLIGGFGGCLIDSWLGATIQSRRRCDACDATTERRIHSCGSVTKVVGGWRWLDNDGVNAASTFAGALIGAAGARYF